MEVCSTKFIAHFLSILKIDLFYLSHVNGIHFKNFVSILKKISYYNFLSPYHYIYLSFVFLLYDAQKNIHL